MLERPWLRRGACVLLVLLGLAGGSRAVERFPQPDFETGYTLPVADQPSPRGAWLAYLDTGVLLAALVLASYLAVRRRSRRGMFVLVIFSLAYFGFWREGCVCPVGATQNMVLALADASYVVPWSVILFFLLPLFFSLLFGRTFCAAVCPLGAIQDVVTLRPVQVPPWLARGLRLVAYLYLGLAVLFVAAGSGFIICRFDPFVALFRRSGAAWILGVAAAMLITGVFVGRPYCRFLCPYGVLLGWCSRWSWRHATITPDECVQCRLCEDTCPYGAIRKPTVDRVAESRGAGVRRLCTLLLLCPVLVALSAGLGYLIGPVLARSHPVVGVSDRVRLEDSGRADGTTLETQAFRAAGRAVADLHAASAAKVKQFEAGTGLLGAFMGVVTSASLINVSVRRRRRDYTPDRTICLSCGRCFAACPRERLRLRKKRGPDDG